MPRWLGVASSSVAALVSVEVGDARAGLSSCTNETGFFDRNECRDRSTGEVVGELRGMLGNYTGGSSGNNSGSSSGNNSGGGSGGSGSGKVGSGPALPDQYLAFGVGKEAGFAPFAIVQAQAIVRDADGVLLEDCHPITSDPQGALIFGFGIASAACDTGVSQRIIIYYDDEARL